MGHSSDTKENEKKRTTAEDVEHMTNAAHNIFSLLFSIFLILVLVVLVINGAINLPDLITKLTEKLLD